MMAYAFLRVRVCLRTGNNEYKAMKPKNELQKYYKSDIIGANVCIKSICTDDYICT